MIHLLSDNQNLPSNDFERVRLLLDEVRALHLGAEAYVTARQLDPEIFLPGNIWAVMNNPSDFMNWSYDMVNYSRAISPFTGFDMMMWGRQYVQGEVNAEEANRFYNRVFSGSLAGQAIAETLTSMGIPQKIERSGRDLARVYDRLVAKVPERFRINPPPRAGEIGFLHHGRILNPDVVTYQSRMNALYGSGVLEAIDRTIASRGSANYLEIGPGHSSFAHALYRSFNGKLNVFLVDLPSICANGITYLSCVAGIDNIALATQSHAPDSKPFIFIPNYLLPVYLDSLPQFDLVHNAISLTEMNAKQAAYYLDLIDELLAQDGVFYLHGGMRELDYHQDALGAARKRLVAWKYYGGRKVGGIHLVKGPNSFFTSRKHLSGLPPKRTLANFFNLFGLRGLMWELQSYLSYQLIKGRRLVRLIWDFFT